MSVFFTDRNLGKRFGLRLREIGLSVELHDDHLPQEAADEHVLRITAKNGWVLLTLDYRIRYLPAEKEAIATYHARVLHLKTTRLMPLLELADHFAGNIQRVERFLRKNPPPLFGVYRVDGKGKARLERKL
ncbi:hypothetical protein [Oceanithermus sp.]|uniref:PIN-like domain-containing protein n=1 Tax=Oceanithermus sp. TaxID=2268145 RepID=UPI0025F7E730|nr:hypothetical protein [Oceanithermus sp.]